MTDDTYKECSCIPGSLHDILKDAVDNLKNIKLADVSDKINEREKIVDNFVAASERTENPLTKEKVMSLFPMFPEEKMFNDLDKYLLSCRCPSEVDFNWTDFPYHPAKVTSIIPGTSGDRRTKSEKLAMLPPSMFENKQHVQTVTNRIYKWFTEEGGLQTLCERMPGQALPWDTVRKEVIALDIVSTEDLDKMIRDNKEIAKITGYDYRIDLTNDLYNFRVKKKDVCPGTISKGRFGRG